MGKVVANHFIISSRKINSMSWLILLCNEVLTDLMS